MKRYLPFFLILAFVIIFEVGCGTDNTQQPNLQAVIGSKLDLGDPYVEQTAVTMARDYPGEFSINQVGAIYDSLVQGWNYYSDPSYKELYKNANLSLQEGMRAGTVGVGDCDDFAIVISSLIDSLGGSTRIIFAYDEASRQGHAYAELYLGKKDSPMIEDLEGWIKDEYGKPSVPGMRLTGDEVWLNLDYNGTYPGGPFFGDKWVSRTVAWESKNKTFPKIVPLIDPMEDLSNWKTLKDELGSNVSIGLVPSKKGRAINLSYDLKDNGWVGISRDVEPQLLADLQGLNISYRMNGKQSTLELRLEDQNGTVFGSSRMLGGDLPLWAYLEAPYDSFTELTQAPAEDPLQKGLEPARIRKLEFVIHNNNKSGDISGPGSISLDQIKGVMRVTKDSPFAKAKDIRDEKVALDLASKSQMVLEGKKEGYLTKSFLLAVESLEHKDTLQGDIAIRRGLALLPRSIAKLEHNDSVNAVAFSPDGKTLATGSYDNTARLWDVETGKQLKRLEHDGSVNIVAFSTDGKTLATGSSDNTSCTWDVKTGELLQRLKQDGSVIDVAFSPDGKILAIGSWDNTAWLWDVQTGKELQRLEHDDYVIDVAFSQDGKTLATGSYDNTARLWDVQTGKELYRLKHNIRLYAVAFSTDGNEIATASGGTVGGGTACIWDVQTGKELQRLEHSSIVYSVAFNPDNKILATGSDDMTARLWDVRTGKELQRLKFDNAVSSVAFAPDGKTLAIVSGNTALLWDVQTGKELKRAEHDDWVKAVALSLDGKTLATASGKTAWLWGIRIGKELQRLEHDDTIYSMAFAPDGKIFATGSWDYTARLWDVRTGKELQRMEHDNTVYEVAFSPNGKTLATRSRFNNTIRLWDVKTGKELQRLKHDNLVPPFSLLINSMVFSPDGKILATGSDDNTSRLWDVQTGKQSQRLQHGDPVEAMAFSPDGTTLATVSGHVVRLWNVLKAKELKRIDNAGDLAFSPDGKILATVSGDIVRLWNVQTGKQLRIMDHDGDDVSAVAFSPDGRILATVSGDIVRLWNVQTGKQLRIMDHDGDDVSAVAFNPDGKIMATASWDIARLWDVQTGKELQRLEHDSIVNDAAFSPDSKTLATASNETANIWDLDCSNLIKEACSRLTRNLTPEEWRQYLGDEPYRETCACQGCRNDARS
jgi:uncharacterized delta-60 repeat protein